MIPRYLELEPDELRRRAAEAAVAALGRLPPLPPGLRRGPPGGQVGGVQDGAPRRRQQRVPPLRRGRLPPGVARVGDHLLRSLQPALRLLSEPRHQPGLAARSGGARDADRSGWRASCSTLQEQGCHNINWVTPEHVVPQVLEALALAVERGLRLPLVYNTSAYDAMESLEWLDGVVDIYMPDLKVMTPAVPARRLLMAEDYPEAATRAIREMHRQVGRPGRGRPGSGGPRRPPAAPGHAGPAGGDPAGPGVARGRAGPGDVPEPHGPVPPRREGSRAVGSRGVRGARPPSHDQGVRGRRSDGPGAGPADCRRPAEVVKGFQDEVVRSASSIRVSRRRWATSSRRVGSMRLNRTAAASATTPPIMTVAGAPIQSASQPA
jgi:hypothetical protein